MRKVKREYLIRAELPLMVEIGEGPRKGVRNLINDLGVSNVVMLTGHTSYELAGSKIEERISDVLVNKFFVRESGTHEVRRIEIEVGYSDVDCVVGVGGGKVLDIAKVLASEINVPFISIPTVASHDGIASPLATFKENGHPISISTKPPAAVIADLVVLKHSPIRLLRSGFGDLLSNITAVMDWKLAKDKLGEEYNEVAASMALMPANLMLSPRRLDFKEINDLEMLVRGLILSGVAISLVGSSRPASGAEHKFNHALNYLGYGKGTHGETVGLGAIMMAYLHEKYYGSGDWHTIRMALENSQAPTTLKEVELSKEQCIEALEYTKEIRKKRYTILEDVNPSRDELELMLKKTELI